MKLSDILTEGFSPVLFRLVPKESFIETAKTNTIKLTPVSRMEMDLPANDFRPLKEYYFLSFARNLSSAFMYHSKSHHSGLDVLYVVDGRRLAHHHIGIPIDFFHVKGRGSTPYGTRKVTDDEMEDRLVSNKPTISNPHQFIQTVLIYIREGVINNDLFEAAQTMTSKGIPVFIYNDRSKFMQANRNGAISFEEYMNNLDPDSPHSASSTWTPMDDHGPHIPVLKSFIEIFTNTTNKFQDLSRNAQDVVMYTQNENSQEIDSLLMAIEASTRNSPARDELFKILAQNRVTASREGIRKFAYQQIKKFSNR